MRIIGNIEHPHIKITVFKMDNKISVKFEMGLLEQTFKFRESRHISNFEDAKKLVDEDFLKNVFANFQILQKNKLAALDRFFPKMDNEFEVII